jgi:hypothetical protein
MMPARRSCLAGFLCSYRESGKKTQKVAIAEFRGIKIYIDRRQSPQPSAAMSTRIARDMTPALG